MLRNDMERYVALRQASGFNFINSQWQLRSFVSFAETCGDDHLRASRAVEWAARGRSAPQCRRRFDTVRRFAITMQAENNLHEVPAKDALGRASFKRRPPYIYTQNEITRLISAAARLNPQETIRPRMYATLFGLLAATGLRLSEALGLRMDNVTDDGLVIIETKFRKSRLIPLHNTTRRALDEYLSHRTPLGVLDGALFVTTTGRVPSHQAVRDTFEKLAGSLGIRKAGQKPRPRIHDLRHTFAVRSLEACQPDHASVSRHIAALSTYLGHTHVSYTYWYLEATPVLLKQITEATELWYQRGVQ